MALWSGGTFASGSRKNEMVNPSNASGTIGAHGTGQPSSRRNAQRGQHKDWPFALSNVRAVNMRNRCGSPILSKPARL